MPHKYNADRRHHIPRPKRRVTNWSEYNEALRQRGSLTVWFTDEAIAAWKAPPRTTLGGQPHYSDLAITTALTLRAVFHLALHQTEGARSSSCSASTCGCQTSPPSAGGPGPWNCQRSPA